MLLLANGCMLVAPAIRGDPFAHSVEHDSLILHSDSPQQGDENLLRELAKHGQQLTEQLHLPQSDRQIHLYLFSDEGQYYHFLDLRFPEFSERRAIFVETEVELIVYAYRGDYVAEDLRHEVSHCYLHAVVPNLPLWLDEGLAEYFEVGASRRGLNRTHLDFLRAQLRDGSWQPNLSRMETLRSAATMTQVDYAESWAWVHFLLQGGVDKRELLTDYLSELRQGKTESLDTRIHRHLAQPELALLEHLRSP